MKWDAMVRSDAGGTTNLTIPSVISDDMMVAIPSSKWISSKRERSPRDSDAPSWTSA
jgi:hypothetical protein